MPRRKSEEEKKYLKDLRKLEWEDNDHHFYQWVAVEANHECSPDNEYMKEFQSIWTGKAENFPEKMNIREWENKRAFYRQLCAYSCYF